MTSHQWEEIPYETKFSITYTVAFFVIAELLVWAILGWALAFALFLCGVVLAALLVLFLSMAGLTKEAERNKDDMDDGA